MRTLAAIVALMLMGMPSGVSAAPELQCGQADAVLKGLKDHNGEVPAFSGVTSAGGPVTITVSPSGSWSMLLTLGSNLCFLAAGDLLKTDADKPQTKAPVPAPGLQPHGLRLVSQ